MRLARKTLRCPECRSVLTGLVRRIETANPIPRRRVIYQTEWVCDGCDTSWLLMRGHGFIRSEEAERLADDDVGVDLMDERNEP